MLLPFPDVFCNSSCCLWQLQVRFRFIPCQILWIPEHYRRKKLAFIIWSKSEFCSIWRCQVVWLTRHVWGEKKRTRPRQLQREQTSNVGRLARWIRAFSLGCVVHVSMSQLLPSIDLVTGIKSPKFLFVSTPSVCSTSTPCSVRQLQAASSLGSSGSDPTVR